MHAAVANRGVTAVCLCAGCRRVACLVVVQDEISPSEAYEHSELLTYKAMVLQEGGQLEAALTLLEQQQVRS